MTKQKAIKLLQELLEGKKYSISVLNSKSFTTDLEEIRQGFAEITQKDVTTLESILQELKPKKKSTKKEK